MNARLRELMLEAGYAAPEVAGRAHKLAELIVRECGSVGDHWVDNEDNGKNLVSDKLKQHFGIEEPPVNDVDRILRTVRTRGVKL